MQMQLSFDVRIPDGLLAANALLREKPHQGVPSWNLAPHQGIDERNSTAAIGLRVGQHLGGVWSRYTGKERDTESGLDYFGARYMSSNMGRFMSPDYSDTPEAVPFGDLENPQSLNLYSYVGNNPLSNIDEDGHCDELYTEVSSFNGVVQSVSQWFTGPCQQNLNGILEGLSNAGSRLAQGLSQAAQQVSSIVHTPGGAGCLAGATATGSMAGSAAAAGPGLVGLAAGGGGVLVTEPLALTIGGAGGAGAGFVAGMTACPGGAANGGGGGGGLSGKARSKLGNLANRAGEKVRDVIRSRGGSGANVNQVGQWADRTLGEAAEAAAKGDPNAETAVKVAKQASRLGQQY
jgi:RHS repeat-associated protein